MRWSTAESTGAWSSPSMDFAFAAPSEKLSSEMRRAVDSFALEVAVTTRRVSISASRAYSRSRATAAVTG